MRDQTFQCLQLRGKGKRVVEIDKKTLRSLKTLGDYELHRFVYYIAFGNYFNGALPIELQSSSLSTILAIVIIILFTWIHSQGLSFGSRVHNIITIGKILIIVCLITLGLTFGTGTFSNCAVPLQATDIFSGNFASSLIFVSFAYTGWNASVYLGGEIKNAKKNTSG